MDTSKNYIKMCEAGQYKIQRDWEPQVGDYVKPDNFDEPQVVTGIDYHYYDLDPFNNNRNNDIDCLNFEDGNSDKYFWLPRQDQIQSIMLKDTELNDLMIDFFGDYLSLYLKLKVNYTMEEIWLRYFMFVKHKMHYRDGKWHKTKSHIEIAKDLVQIANKHYFKLCENKMKKTEKIDYDNHIKDVIAIVDEQKNYLNELESYLND